MKPGLLLAGLFACVTASAACGGKIEESGSGTTTGTTPAPTVTGTSSPPSPGSPGQPTPVPAPGKEPTPASNKVFTAQAMPGGLDHVMIFAADHGADSCVRIHMTRPFSAGQNAPYANVTTAKEWGIRDISRSPGSRRCGPGRQPPSAEEASDAKGAITFTPVSGSVYPCSLDVHLVALFDDAPTVEQLDGDKIAVAGCQ